MLNKQKINNWIEEFNISKENRRKSDSKKKETIKKLKKKERINNLTAVIKRETNNNPAKRLIDIRLLIVKAWK